MKRFLRWLGIGLLALILFVMTALFLFFGWLKRAGDRDWKRAQAELQAKGEKLTLAELLPTPPPDSQNFYADPMWREIADVVPVKDEVNGSTVTSWKPRIPKDKLLINQWMRPLSVSEKEQILRLLPNIDLKISGGEELLFAIKNLNWELSKTTDPARRREIALLQIDLMKPAAPLLARITELLRRPYAVFSTNAADPVEMDQINYLLTLGQLFSSRAHAERELGDHSAAASDALTLLRLSANQSPTLALISHLVRVATLSMPLDSINSGIQSHQWSDSELAEFQQQLTQINLITELCFALRGERAYFNSYYAAKFLEAMGVSPQMLARQFIGTLEYAAINYNKGYHNMVLQRGIERLQQEADHGINTKTSLFKQELATLENHPFKKWLHFIEIISLSNLDGIVQKTIEIQTQISQTLIACALERYHLAHGSYPSSLDPLIPEYLTSVPKEPTTGNPMQYRLIKDGTFLLWSPGWKLQTLDGKPGEFYGEGDIVCNQPIPRKSHSAPLPTR